MWAPDICIYHAECLDGFGAAWAIWKRWGDAVRYIPMSYGKFSMQDDEFRDKNILFVDFSLNKTALHELGKIAKSIVVIDHHKTAQDELKDFYPFTGNEVGQDVFVRCSTYGPKIVVWFDMEQSGAVMAWKFAHTGKGTPPVLMVIEDRDLWKFEFTDTKSIIAALSSYPRTFETWDTLMSSDYRLHKEGISILRAHNADIEQMLAHTLWMRYDDSDGNIMGIPIVNVPRDFSSDVCHRLLELYPDAQFAVAWFINVDGKIQYSLRSTDKRADVSEIAKRNGGGGHRNAAGFVADMMPGCIEAPFIAHNSRLV